MSMRRGGSHCTCLQSDRESAENQIFPDKFAVLREIGGGPSWLSDGKPRLYLAFTASLSANVWSPGSAHRMWRQGDHRVAPTLFTLSYIFIALHYTPAPSDWLTQATSVPLPFVTLATPFR